MQWCSTSSMEGIGVVGERETRNVLLAGALSDADGHRGGDIIMVVV